MKLQFSKKSVRPKTLGLPEIKVKSFGRTVYKPRFYLDQNGKVILELGHYYGFGAYYMDTITDIKSGGVQLFGLDTSLDSVVGDLEIRHLQAYLAKYGDKIVNKLKSNFEVAV